MTQYRILNSTIHSSNIKKIRIILEKRLNKKNEPRLITTFNLDFLRLTDCDLEFNEICNNSLYNLPDGFGITSLIRLKYGESINRITGNDIFPLLLDIANKNEYKIAIVGGSTEVSKKVEQKILENFNFKKDRLLCISPSNNFEQNNNENATIIAKVSAFKPNILFAALGCPRQEKWLYKNMNLFGSQVNIGIGATLDYYSGKKKRSPRIMQEIGLEWLWRLINEPTRLFSRYIFKDIPFIIKTILLRKY